MNEQSDIQLLKEIKCSLKDMHMLELYDQILKNIQTESDDLPLAIKWIILIYDDLTNIFVSYH